MKPPTNGVPSSSYYESNRLSMKWRVGLVSMVREMMPVGWESMELLDLGVGDGYTIRLLKPAGRITGVDFKNESLLEASQRGIEVKEGSVYSIPFPDGRFDVLTCVEVLEHLEEPSKAISEISRVLKPGGYLVATTPVPNIRWKVIWWFWTKLGPGKRWNDIPHVTELHIDKAEAAQGGLLAMLKESGFDIVNTAKCNYGMIAGVIAKKQNP